MFEAKEAKTLVRLRGGKARYRTWLVIGLVLADMLVVQGPLRAAEGEITSALSVLRGRPVGDSPEALFRQVIKSAYETLSRYSQASGTGLSFRLYDFHTYYPGELDSLLLTDLETLPEGRMIDVAHKKRSVVEPDGSIKKIVRYEATWRDHESFWRVSPEAGEAAVVTLGEVIHRLGDEEDVRFKVTRAVTSYRVTATLGGESRTYLALVYWFSKENPPTWKHLDLLLIDNITQGVERALREEIPLDGQVISSAPGARLQEKGEPSAPAPLPRADLGTKGACAPGATSGGLTVAGMGINSHLSGSHNASAQLGYTCGCSPDCRETCSATVRSARCEDSGIPSGACHKMVYAEDGESSLFVNALPTCTAAFKCAQRACLFCQCNFSVTVKVVAGEATFGGDSVDWSYQRSATFDCPVCPANPGDGGGGGGVGGCSATSTTMTVTSIESGVTVSRSKGSYVLRRKDDQDHVRFLLDDWAVVAYLPAPGGAPIVDLLGSSSPTFAADALETVRSGRAFSSPETLLVVEAPVHPRNSRYIPAPTIRLLAAKRASKLPAGEVVVRADFAKSGGLMDLKLLQSSLPDSRGVLDELQDRLQVGFQTEKHHRVIAFLVIETGDDMKLLASEPVLPQCCCGIEEPFCV